MVKPMVHSEKHYVQFSVGTLAAGVLDSKTPIAGVATDAKNAVGEVLEGASVKAIFVEFWVASNASTMSSVIVAIEKTSGDMTGLEAGTIAALGDYTNKKNVFYVTQGLVSPNTAQPLPLFRAWVKIPKSKQRFGLGDKLRIHTLAQGGTAQFCGFTTYKEYY